MTLAKTISEQTRPTESLLVSRPASPSHRSSVTESNICTYQIERVLREIDPPRVRESVGTVFQNLLALIECLHLIESHLRQVDAADETFALFRVIHDEARALVNFIRTDALNIPSMSEELLDTLDGITFALGHDLQRVFDADSPASLAGHSRHVIVGKLSRAHDVLTNCLQQSTITLAMVFDPELEGSKLFNNSDMRYRQSLQLCEDIAALIKLIETMEENSTEEAQSDLEAGIEKFRQESLECLMYSDWPQFESFCELIALPSEFGEVESTLHQFRCYLETLLGQVRMRAVLANVFPVQFGDVENGAIATSFADVASDPTAQDTGNENNYEETADSLALAG